MQITRDLNLELHKQELPHTVTQYIPVFRIAPHLETFQQKDHRCWYLKNRGPSKDQSKINTTHSFQGFT